MLLEELIAQNTSSPLTLNGFFATGKDSVAIADLCVGTPAWIYTLSCLDTALDRAVSSWYK